MKAILPALCAALALLTGGCGSKDENAAPQMAVEPAHGVKDPVCGMIVDPKTSPKSQYKGKTYYFCSREDKDRFDKAPAEFAGK